MLIGTAVVALFATLGSSLKATIENVVDEDFGGDLIVVTHNFSGAGIAPEVATEIATLPEVTTSVGLGLASADIDGAAVRPSVADPIHLGAVLDLDVSRGSFDDVTAGRVAVSDDYAEEHGLETGSSIAMVFADGSSAEFEVGATYAWTTNVGDAMTNVGALIMTPQDWLPQAQQPGDVAVMIDLAAGVSERQGAAAVAEVTRSYAAPDPQTRSDYIDSVAAEADQVLYFVYGMLAIAILIALMGIANTLSLSIHERTRELGLLRAVGQTRRQVRATVRWESVIVAVLGTVGGVGLGTFLGWGLMRAIAAEEGAGVFAIPVTSLGAVLVLAAVAGVVAAWRPSTRAAKLDILTAIATE